MDGLKERILEVASQDEDFGKKLSEAEAPEAVVELLRERGLDVAVEDLQALAQPADQDAVELSDDELEAVAGGGECGCSVYGGGKAGGKDKSCGCYVYGQGGSKGEGVRCGCVYGGWGDSCN